MNTTNYFVQLLKKQILNINRFVQYQLLIHNKINTSCFVIDGKQDNQGRSSILNSLLFSKDESSEINREKLLEEIRLARKQLGNRVVVGKSTTEIDDELQKFQVGDRSHPQSDEIYAALNRLTMEVLADGYVPDGSWISRKLRKNETILSVLSGHSERLALAANFALRSNPSSIQLVNNLRMCIDCHQFMKRVAKVRQCEIRIRDANRIHHFTKDGECSCKDHF